MSRSYACNVLDAFARASAREPGSLERLVDGLAAAPANEDDPHRLARFALDAAVADADAERGLLFLVDDAGDLHLAARVDEQLEAQDAIGMGSSYARRVIASGEDILESNPAGAEPIQDETRPPPGRTTHVLCVAIRARGRIAAVLYLDARSRHEPFARRTVAVTRVIGSMVGASLLALPPPAEIEAQRPPLGRDATPRERSAGGDPPEWLRPSIRRLLAAQTCANAADVAMVVQGEPGTGKKLVARALHAASARRDRPFLALACGASSPAQLEAELFGAEHGPQLPPRPGLLTAADGGTLLLDGVGDLPLPLQLALLRALEARAARPVGASRARRIDVRVIATTDRPLHELVSAGVFRADLHFFLEVVRIDVPPLRAHVEDLPDLAEHLLREAREQTGVPPRKLSPEAAVELGRRAWPGNVRELRRSMMRAALVAEDGVIRPEDLPEARPSSIDHPAVLHRDGHAARADMIRNALRAAAGHRSRAAKLLGISRSTLYRQLELYGIDVMEFRPSPPEESK